MASLVFDLDGTLIDSVHDIHAIANKVLVSEGFAPISLDQARGFVGRGASVFIDEMRALYGVPEAAHDRWLAGFMAAYEGAVELTPPYPGVIVALDHLKAQGHALGLCTNKPLGPTMAVLRHLKMDDYFQVVIGGDSLDVRKPDPAPLWAAFEALPEGPQLYLGDSEVDAETAQNADIPFLLFTEGYRKTPVSDLPHRVAFQSWSDVPALVDGLLKP